LKRIGVDVGGTFTDLIYWDDAAGTALVHKTPSTPEDPSVGTMNGIRELCSEAGVEPSELEMLFHGTTVATNSVLEHEGAKVGLLTTEGFRDILHIARKKRPYNFSSYQDVPWQKHPLARRRHRLPVKERITASGQVETPLDEEGARRAIRSLKETGVEAVAVCFLFSFVNPRHEARVRAILHEEFPEAYVCLSSDIAPQYREYERFSTTALNAFIGPKVSGYVGNLMEAVAEAGIADDVHLMTSAGGVVTGRGAAEKPVMLLLSGPVAGLLAGVQIGKASGVKSVITLDVGGTSADIGVAPDGVVRTKHLLDTRIGGYNAMVPMADLETIGAGGGSIASVDAGGMFRVGPRSAGADPGPACYGRGGEEPTATDALVLLGWLRPESFLGGQMTIYPERARRAVEERLAGPLGMSAERAAVGTFQVLAHAMIDAISLHSVRKGLDPREFALVAEGGAGPLFAWAIAEEMEIPKVVVPRYPGIASAIGLLTTEMRYEFPSTVWQLSSTLDANMLNEAFDRLEELAVDRLKQDGVEDKSARVERSADCRYVGQGYELRVPVPDGPVDDGWLAQTIENFEAAHERTYFRRFSGTDVQIVNVYVAGVGSVPKLEIRPIEGGSADASDAVKFEGSVLFGGAGGGEPERLQTRFYDREKLRAGNEIQGPAVIEQQDTTTIVGPSQRAVVDEYGHLIIEGGTK
jgi:N-methylhydantoinase A/oxoprolinase/acetone carboxylase beta subunit